jgi:hypothetical protein
MREIDIIEAVHCKEVSDGVFELIPVDTAEDLVPSIPVPREVVITLGKNDRLLEAYYHYMTISKQFENKEFDPNWLLSGAEIRVIQKAILTMQAAERKLEKFGIDVSSLNKPESIGMLDHPMVKSYIHALDENDRINIEFTDKRLDRQKKANVLTVQQRFIIDVFLIVTEDISDTMTPKKRYTEEELLNEPYWAQQADLLHDVFHMVLKYVLTELDIRVKKTKVVYDLCEAVGSFLAESVKEESQKMKGSTSSNNSTSSQSSTKQEFENLKKVTLREK